MPLHCVVCYESDTVGSGAFKSSWEACKLFTGWKSHNK